MTTENCRCGEPVRVHYGPDIRFSPPCSKPMMYRAECSGYCLSPSFTAFTQERALELWNKRMRKERNPSYAESNQVGQPAGVSDGIAQGGSAGRPAPDADVHDAGGSRPGPDGNDSLKAASGPATSGKESPVLGVENHGAWYGAQDASQALHRTDTPQWSPVPALVLIINRMARRLKRKSPTEADAGERALADWRMADEAVEFLRREGLTSPLRYSEWAALPRELRGGPEQPEDNP